MDRTWQDQRVLATRPRTPSRNWGFRYRAWIGSLVLAPAGILTLLSRPWMPQPGAVSLIFHWLGWAAFLTGAAMRLWATFYIGGRKRAQLVTSGPYSLCRNPLYVGSFLVALSAGLFLESPLLVAAVGLAAVGYACTTVPCEERELRSIHKAAYADYCRRTRRFWPRFANFQTDQTLPVSVPALRLEAKRMLVWVWLPFICEVVQVARAAPWWPRLFNLP